MTSWDDETKDWLDSFDAVVAREGRERAKELFGQLAGRAGQAGLTSRGGVTTPYVNTIPATVEPPYPGDETLERRIRSLIRWNAMAMVVRANREEHGIGGHISTYASAATLLEVGFNHFFRARTPEHPGDQVYFQGHASPGVYARAFLEGRLSVEQLERFRRELDPKGGLASYPHPWLMPEFWEFPTVSMGLGPIQAIYRARFIRYLEDRGLKEQTDTKVWAFVGDGETDEPESLGALTLAAREQLDNLIFVVNCNQQRLDGPVRGNGKIIQELECVFRGAGWNVIKVVWGSSWDPILARDANGLLVRRMGEVVDGQFQRYGIELGDVIRKHFFGVSPELEAMVSDLTDEEIRRLTRGGHDPVKIYAAYNAAVNHKGAPTAILANTIKGYGLGEAGEGKNVTHQQKKLNEDELRDFRTRFGIPISDEEVAFAPFFRPPDDSPEMVYLRERRQALGGYLPQRTFEPITLTTPANGFFDEFHAGSESHPVSTTMAFVRILTKLLRHPELGKLVVPIVPDEARTFGMDPLFRQVGIYARGGQLYEPVDSENLVYYKEAKDGQILEEGITEAGSMASFIAAGTAYATHGVPTIPFFIFYSMFGMQRIGDLVWAAGDSRSRGFLLGATSGRTTLAGEGLQHQDGHSHLWASAIPNLVSYDPAYAYELAVIIQEGLRRMYEQRDDVFYYLTLTNENYDMPAMPEGAQEGILRGMYKLRPSERSELPLKAQLLGSGALLNEALRAQHLLAEQFGVAADVWSVTSYTQLRREALEVDRWNLLHPEAAPHIPYVTECIREGSGPIVAASDYVKALPDGLARWVPRPLVSLGTDGFGRSDSRRALRNFFEVDARFIALGALHGLAKAGVVERSVVTRAIQELEIDPGEGESGTCVDDRKGQGMSVEFRLPELGEGTVSATVAQILVAVGDTIKVGQAVLEIESEKAVLEVPSSVAGTVEKVHAEVGKTVKVGDLILQVSGVAAPEAARPPAPEPPKRPEPPAAPPAASETQPPIARTPGTGPALASPSVRRLARELGVDIERVPGSGDNGRITPEDVRAFSGPRVQPATELAPPPSEQPLAAAVERAAMSAIRRKTALHVASAWQTIPHVTHFDKADVTSLESFRQQYAKRVEATGGKLTMTSVLLKVLGAALRKFPKFNATVDMENQEIVYQSGIHVSVAVDTDRGLLVPVIRDVDRKGLLALAVELTRLAEKARAGKLAVEDMHGGTFTITNLGGIGGTGFTPIINAPQVAILGVSRTSVEPVFIHGTFAPRSMLPLALAYDHRIIDGAEAARFLRWVAEALEQPFVLLLEGV